MGKVIFLGYLSQFWRQLSRDDEARVIQYIDRDVGPNEPLSSGQISRLVIASDLATELPDLGVHLVVGVE